VVVSQSLAFAQEFELDLSEPKAHKAPPELRPTIALLKVRRADDDPITASRAKLLEDELLRLTQEGDEFKTVMDPALAERNAFDRATEFSGCESFACFESAARVLKVDRVVKLSIAKSGAGHIINFFGFDPGLPEMVTATHDSLERAEKTFVGMVGRAQSLKDRDFMKKVVPILVATLGRLTTANGTLNVDNIEQSSVVSIDGVEVGSGSLTKILQRGKHTVLVTSEGYRPFAADVAIEPLMTANLKVTLVAKPAEVSTTVVPVEILKAPFYQRPGLYVAVVGAVAVAVGTVFGLSASRVQSRLAAGGDPVSVTRNEAKNAASNGLVANLLWGVGGAMIVGGGAWFILTPGVAPATKGLEPSESGLSGVTLGFGGTF
jgi:hypothetical protein